MSGSNGVIFSNSQYLYIARINAQQNYIYSGGFFSNLCLILI